MMKIVSFKKSPKMLFSKILQIKLSTFGTKCRLASVSLVENGEFQVIGIIIYSSVSSSVERVWTRGYIDKVPLHTQAST